MKKQTKNPVKAKTKEAKAKEDVKKVKAAKKIVKKVKQVKAKRVEAKRQAYVKKAREQHVARAISIPEEEWEKKLTPEQFHILRRHGTEMPFTGKYVQHDGKGMYVCAGCGAKLFSSSTKFESGTGWPSFFEAVKNSVKLKDDSRLGMHRIEVSCKKCGGHLGHVFDDGPMPAKKRFCINSCALDFRKK